jgi:hypothetical protein
MLLHSEPLRLESAASAAEVEHALRIAGAEWRESTLSASARAAGILGWKVRLSSGRVVIRARIGGQNGFLPHFVGRLRDVPTGSVLEGELRLSWFPRAFMLLWLTLAGGAPVIALIGPIPGAGFGEHVVVALFMLVPAIGLFSFGLWMAQRNWSAPAAAFKEFLTRASQAAVTPPNVGFDVRGV